MIKRVVYLIVALSFLTAIACGSGDPEDSGQGIHVDDKTVAINGADVVAYHTIDASSDAVLGSKEYQHDWKGATWQFASEENRDAFAADPERYAPQYGGYCAYAMAQDKLVGTDPNAWTVRDGKLFLNATLKGRTTWREDISGYVAKADGYWPDWLQKLLTE